MKKDTKLWTRVEPEIQEKNPNLKRLILAQEDYIKLLTKELDELAVLANSHGWKSSRAEEGDKCREKIKELKRSVANNKLT